jgi:hypothetical protein
VTKVPGIGADNYGQLAVTKGNLVYSIQPPFYYGRQAEIQPSVRIYSIKDRKETTLVTNAGGVHSLRRRLQIFGEPTGHLLRDGR